MAISTSKNALNLRPGSVPVVVHLSQGDVGRTIEFQLHDGGVAVYPNGNQVSVHGVRKDGVGIGPYTVSTTYGSNSVSFDVTSEMAAIEGPVLAELTITDGNGASVGSANFVMAVEKGVFPNGPVYSSDISVYQQILSYVQSIPADLREDISELQRKSKEYPAYVTISDSYGEYAGYGWITKFKAKLGLVEGTTLFKSAIGGAGFAKADDSLNFVKMLSALAGTMTSDQKNSVGTVICIGGSNEVGFSQEALEAAIASFCTDARSYFPNAKVYIGMATGNHINNYVAAQSTRVLGAYKSAQKHDKCYFLDNLQYCFHNRALIGTDLVHPTQDGFTYLTQAIITALEDHFSYFYTYRDGLMTAPNGVTFGSTPLYRTIVDNEIAHFTCQSGIAATFANPVNWGYGADVQIAQANADFIGTDVSLFPYNCTITPITVFAYWPGATFTTRALLWFDSTGGIWLRNVDSYQTGQTSGYSSVTVIRVGPFAVTCPSIAC